MRDASCIGRVVAAVRRRAPGRAFPLAMTITTTLVLATLVSMTHAQEVMVLEEDELEVAPERPNARYLLRHTDVRSTGSLLFPELDERLRERAESPEGSGESLDAPEPE